MTPTARNVRNLSVVNLLGVCSLVFVLFEISERWWLSAALTYLPRSPYLLPSLVLLACSAKWHRRSIWLNLVSAVLVIGPVMELALPWKAAIATRTTRGTLKVVSCNVQGYRPAFGTVLQELSALNPDVVAFQEAIGGHPLLDTYFKDWHTVLAGEFWVGSRYPLRLVDTCKTASFGRVTAIGVEVDAPDGKFLLFNLHQTTAREGLEHLNPKSVSDGKGPRRLQRHVLLRQEEARTTRMFVSSLDPSLPLLVVGDFNMPRSSSLYRTYWGDLRNAFQRAGFGFGYTSPCSPHRLWPDYTPGLRIDHILAGPHWTVHRSQTGRKNGSDHRLIAATLSLH